MNYKKITVAGSGVLGSQIAFQTAFKGFDVTIYDIDDKALAVGREKIAALAAIYESEIRHAESGYDKASVSIQYNKNLLPNLDDMLSAQIGSVIRMVEGLPSKIAFTSDLAAAVADADLVIEAIPERMKIKADFYTKISNLAP
ncbi:MAG: 3-hydroxyacyl-CoA dehydrogenase NAD-binding domain-containing protein, partial [Oscillospiraceae bacterium]|nr:3-hydroxyacyl-CoA dehydrogenase NAD-binding domain-containing protein [Oscillospiraceae bacterium]